MRALWPLAAVAWVAALLVAARPAPAARALDAAASLDVQLVVTDDAFASRLVDQVSRRGVTHGPVILTRSDLAKSRGRLPCDGDIVLLTRDADHGLEGVTGLELVETTRAGDGTGYVFVRYRRR
jgi:hypothetical protein